MERKIGEIFKYNGEWYQCVKSVIYCPTCAFFRKKCNSQVLGECSAIKRSDKENVIFKKLEKVGKPFIGKVHIQLQIYKIYAEPIVNPTENIGYVDEENMIAIEIKQNKEDMEEQHSTENYPSKEEKIAERIANKVGEDIQNQLEKNTNKLKLKPFSLEAAKAGKPVCTRDGRKARIICFDRKDNTPIVALIERVDGIEILQCFYNDGKCFHDSTSDNDLMMLSEKKEGWANIYRSQIYDTLERAKEAYKRTCNDDNYLQTIKIEWEE